MLRFDHPVFRADYCFEFKQAVDEECGHHHGRDEAAGYGFITSFPFVGQFDWCAESVASPEKFENSMTKLGFRLSGLNFIYLLRGSTCVLHDVCLGVIWICLTIEVGDNILHFGLW